MPVVDPLKESLLHATCVVVGTKGVLLLGESGSGKSTLALSLMAWAQQRDMWTALVGDDRLFVHYSNGRLVARSHPKIAHLIECRYLGILSSPFSSPLQEEAQIHLCVDLKSSDSDAACSRLPAHEEFLLQNEKGRNPVLEILLENKEQASPCSWLNLPAQASWENCLKIMTFLYFPHAIREM